ncbi:MAG TPA: helix-turn-helix domain-containing protein [Isosphaeraceae bacterium]|nr:helix-turn-helix domain-containing protein [Isosphaeraceae bacterium]
MPEGHRRVLELKAEGLSCSEIGLRLGISERTAQRVIEGLRGRGPDESTSGPG